jgi:hypothetical protein
MATLAALAVSGLASPYCGIAIADGPGATATGGSGAGSLFQQNTAQEHGQNNNCANPGTSTAPGTTALVDGSVDTRCATGDVSFNEHSVIEGGDAHAVGGSGTGTVAQQNTAQVGRQNNNCANPNDSDISLTGGRADSGCTVKDASHTKHSHTEGGDTHAEGGSSTGASAFQQNTAQSGRQNNNCANPNNAVINTTASRAETGCETVDHSTNVGTVEFSDGAEAKGGSSTLDVFQQNTAQSGRQNNNCGNSNDLTPSATGSNTQTQCVAIDRSTNIGTVYR